MYFFLLKDPLKRTAIKIPVEVHKEEALLKHQRLVVAALTKSEVEVIEEA